jgi:hypothetical protein
MRRARLYPLAIVASIALLVPLASAPAASAASFKATLKAPNHHPKAGTTNWVITVTAKSNSGKAIKATAFYQFIFNGKVVSTQYPAPNGGTRHSPWSFKGSYRDAILWPARAAGINLTFRVVVKAKGKGTRNLDWAVRVRR